MNLLFGYRIIDGRCGFPDNALDKVASRMSLEKINYKIITNKDILTNKMAHYKPNNYNKIAKRAILNIKLTDKIKLLEEKILNLKEQELLEIIEYINEKY